MTTSSDHPRLAFGPEGEVLDIPTEQTGWLVKRHSGGCPRTMRDRHGDPINLGLHETPADLKSKVRDRPGLYRLYPIDAMGSILPDAPVAEYVIEVNYTSNGMEELLAARQDRLLDLCERFMTSLDTKDMLMRDVTQSLIDTQAKLQSGAVELLGAASTGMNVATGVERPELDMTSLSRHIADEVEQRQNDKPGGSHWLVELANGRLGEMFGKLVSDLTVLTINRHPAKK